MKLPLFEKSQQLMKFASLRVAGKVSLWLLIMVQLHALPEDIAKYRDTYRLAGM